MVREHVETHADAELSTTLDEPVAERAGRMLPRPSRPRSTPPSVPYPTNVTTRAADWPTATATLCPGLS